MSQFENLLIKRHDVARSWKSKDKPVIGWSCSYTPEEIIYAAGGLPVMVYGDTENTTLADTYLPTNTCSFVRGCLNTVLKGDYDYLDGFITAGSCDNRNKIFDMWKYYAEIPFLYFFNTPHTRYEEAQETFYEEILRLKASYENFLGKTISDDSLKKAIQDYNMNRVLLKRVYDLRKKGPPLISGVEALEIVLSSMLIPKMEHNKLLEQLLAKIPNRTDLPKDGVRLLISGSVMDTTALIRTVEEMGGRVVIDDLCIGSRYFWDLVNTDDDPLRAIAQRYLNKVPSSFVFGNDKGFEHTIELAEQYDVEAVIIFVLKFCDPHMFDGPQLIEEFEALGFPALYLEWDHSLSGVAQLTTRIEAFLEMVRGIE